jgi:signal transduction histidine kinase/DNA-binding response OmpR family regulator
MNFEYMLLSYMLEAVIIFVLLYIYFKNIISTYIQDKEKLQNRIEGLKKELFEKEKTIQNSNPAVPQTSFISAEIKKREALEENIEKLHRIIEDTKNIAQDATIVKNNFLSTIRHEIRTPLNSILVFAQMLYKENTNKRLKGFANDILSSGTKLLIMLDNMIELSKIKSDSLKITQSVVNVNEFFKSNLEKFKNDIEKKGLKLSVNIDKDMPKALILDKVRVSDIFNNLITNAIKFTKDGYIEVIIKVDKVNVVNNLVDISISVKDSGVGISKTNQHKIFEIFETKDSDDDIEYQGRGVELSINRKIAQIMDGDLEVESELSKGSVFTLRLRGVEVALLNDDEDTNVELDFSTIRPDGANILVIDDDKNDFEILKECFLNTSLKLLFFDNSRDAITALKKQKIDLILIDVSILSIDDGAVAKVIKTVSDASVVTLTNKRIKNIVFSDAGVKPEGHLKKPISRFELFKILSKFLNKKENIDIVEFVKEQEDGNDILDIRDIKDLEMFLKAQDIILAKLYREASSTNDLNAIKVFSTSLLELSLKYKIQDMVEYSKLLLKKVDTFEIDEINEMLGNYKIKIEQFGKMLK